MAPRNPAMQRRWASHAADSSGVENRSLRGKRSQSRSSNESSDKPIESAPIQHEEEELPYAIVTLPDGRVVRQCRASESCPLREAAVEKRQRMVDHLLLSHGLQVDIPKLPLGRRRRNEWAAHAFPHPSSERWKRQAEKRAKDKDYKLRRNYGKYENGQRLKAAQAWDALLPKFKTTSKEEFIGTWLQKRMQKYMSTIDARKEKIERGIASIDAKEVPPTCKEDEPCHGSMQPCVKAKPKRKSTKKVAFEATSAYKEEMPTRESVQPCAKTANINANATMGSKAAKKKLPIRSCRATSYTLDSTPIVISSPSPSEVDKDLHITLVIFNAHVSVEVGVDNQLDDASKLTTSSRLSCGASIRFMSKRSLNFVQVDQELMTAMIMDEASSETINLFAMWMENKLAMSTLEKVLIIDSIWFSLAEDVVGNFLDHCFKQVNVSSMELCFFPIIFRALERLAPYIADPHVRASLSNPTKELEVKVLQVPQQPNDVDCGFYIMAYMHFLIEGILEGRLTKKWLTNQWFKHKDVENLRVQLHTWCMQCLDQV